MHRPIALGTALALFLAAPLPAVAQGGEPAFGFVAGVNRTTLSRNSVDGGTGGAFGLTTRWPLAGAVRLRVDGLVTRRVVRHDIGGCPFFFPCTPDQVLPPGTRSVRLTQFDVPVLLEARATRGAVRPWVLGGPYGSARIGCSARDDHGTVVASSSCADDLRGLHAGFVVGGGIELGRVGVGVRWTRSLTSLSKPVPADGSSLFGDAHLSTLSLVVEVGDLFR